MPIKEVLEYRYNYTEYIFLDKNLMWFVCAFSVPLPNGRAHKAGMEVKKIYVFSIQDISIKQIEDEWYKNIEILHNDYFSYALRDNVFNAKKSLVCIGRLIISLKNDFPNGFPKNILDGDFIQFNIDRLDCEFS